MRLPAPIGLLLLLLAACGGTEGESPRYSRTRLGELDPASKRTWCAVGPRFERVTVLRQGAGRTWFEVDGEAHEAFDGVGGFVFSPDGGRFAYWGERAGKVHPVVDGVVGEAYSRISDLTFSPDGARLAFFADDNRIVVDGEEGPRHGGVGREGPVFSPDGRRLAYEVIDDWKMKVVVDGVEGPPYAVILGGTLTFGPVGKRVAYLAKRKDRYFLVLDGKEGKPYGKKMIRRIVFSPDGTRIAYAAQMDRGFMVIVDEEEGPLYDRIQAPGPRFSADGESVAYGARRGREWFCVLDGSERGPYEGVAEVTFCPATREPAYLALRRGSWFPVIDGEEWPGHACEAVGGLTFSADGEHHAYAVLNRDETVSMILDGDRIGTWDVVNSDVPPRFDDSGALVFAVIDGPEICRIEVRPR